MRHKSGGFCPNVTYFYLVLPEGELYQFCCSIYNIYFYSRQLYQILFGHLQNFTMVSPYLAVTRKLLVM